MILTSSDASLLHRWEVAEYISEGFVILACAGELIADLATCVPRRQRKRIERWSTILLVAALAASLKCLIRTNELSGSVIGSLGAKAGEADNKANKAIRDSGTALSKAGEAKQKVVDVGQQADALTLRMGGASRKLGELEQDIRAQGPRWRLLEDNKTGFITALKPFAGQPITVVTCDLWISSANPEPLRVEQDLVRFLGQDGAGWSAGYRSWDRCLITSAGGIDIRINRTASIGVQHAAEALRDTLRNIKISANLYGTSTRPIEVFFGVGSPEDLARKDPTGIFLSVGPNPTYDLTGVWDKAKAK
jgi:hypothetical protein